MGMGGAYTTSKNEVLKNTSVVVGASETNTVVSNVITLSAEDSKYLLVKVVANTTTVAVGITATLQESYDGINWESSGSTVAIAGNSTYEINHIVQPGTKTTLWPLARITVSSGAGDTTTIAEVYFSKRG